MAATDLATIVGQLYRQFRREEPKRRDYCPACKAELTSTDREAGYCTQCYQPISRKMHPELPPQQWRPEIE